MSSPQLVYDVEKVNHHSAHTAVPTGAPQVETSAVPPSSVNGVTIASIFLTLCGIGLGLTAGLYTTKSHDETSTSTQQLLDRNQAQVYGVLGIAAFAISVPLVACGAKQQISNRGSTGLPACMILGWIGFGLGMLDALILLATSALGLGDVQPVWVYLAILWNVIPFLLFLAHAEFARRH